MTRLPEPLPAEKRRSKRHPCNVAAVVVVDRVRHDARVRDVSALGCCFASPLELAKGDEILCELGGLSVVATIAWSSPPLHGANFHREIDPRPLLRDKDRPGFLNRRLANSMTGTVD